MKSSASSLRCLRCAMVLALLPLTVARGQTTSTLQVLFLGNSLTAGNDVPAIVQALAQLQGVRVNYDTRAPGGYALEDHFRDGAQLMLQQKHYDVLIMQQGPSTLAENQIFLRDWAVIWGNEARRFNTRPALFMVWPTNGQSNGFALVSQSYRNAALASDAAIFPAGEAWAEVVRLDPSIQLYADDLHGTQSGSYLAAMVIARGLVALDPARVPARLQTAGGLINIPESHAQRFRSIVAALPATSITASSATGGGSAPSAADLTATYDFSTLAGAASAASTDGAAADARFASPSGLAIDAAGTLYIADTDNDTIRKITAAGQVSTLAGSPGRRDLVNGTGAAARMNAPPSVAVDTAGNVYVADNNNAVIRKITAAGTVTTFAGQPGATGTVDGNGGAARFVAPISVATDSAGNIYVADFGAHNIRKITPGGDVTTLAGSANNPGASDGLGAAATFRRPRALATDVAGNLYVADRDNQSVRKITPSGQVTTLAGASGSSGSADGLGSAARFFFPEGIATDVVGNLYVADTFNHAIRKISPGGSVSTLAGAALQGGSADGAGTQARFVLPEGITVDAGGNVFVADTVNHTIRKINPAGIVTTFAGLPPAASSGSADGIGSAARFRAPHGLGLSPAGDIFVADRSNFFVRKITNSGAVTTLTDPSAPPGGLVVNALFAGPIDVAVDASGTIFVADANRQIRKITASGTVSNLVGNSAIPGAVDGTGGNGRFEEIGALALDDSGNLFATDRETVRKITPAGEMTTLAGSFGLRGNVDGTASAARFNRLGGIARDSAGNLYVADTVEHTIRKITPAGIVTTLAGQAGAEGRTDGDASVARFRQPTGVAVDSTGIIFIADTGNELIRRISPNGNVTTIGGLAGAFGGADGIGGDARFSSPHDIAVDSAGTLFITNRSPDANTVRKAVRAPVTTPPAPTTAPPPSTSTGGGGGGGGGGGANEPRLLVALLVLWFARLFRHRRPVVSSAP